MHPLWPLCPVPMQRFSPQNKFCGVSLLCLGLELLTMLPVYGGGGHGPMRWRTLAEFLNELNMLYGLGAIPMVYGITLLLLGGYLLIKNRRKREGQ